MSIMWPQGRWSVKDCLIPKRNVARLGRHFVCHFLKPREISFKMRCKSIFWQEIQNGGLESHFVSHFLKPREISFRMRCKSIFWQKIQNGGLRRLVTCLLKFQSTVAKVKIVSVTWPLHFPRCFHYLIYLKVQVITLSISN